MKMERAYDGILQKMNDDVSQAMCRRRNIVIVVRSINLYTKGLRNIHLNHQPYTQLTLVLNMFYVLALWYGGQ